MKTLQLLLNKRFTGIVEIRTYIDGDQMIEVMYLDT